MNKPRILREIPNLEPNTSAWSMSVCNVADPTLPVPTIPTLRSSDDNQKAECTARSARVAS